MSKFTNLLTNTFKQYHVDMITETLRCCNVTCTVITGVTKYTDCPNCIFDPIANRSTNRYQAGGPISFSVGLCPYCNGIGKIPDEQTETVTLCPIYDYKSWIPQIESNVESPEGFVQTLSLFSTYSTLEQAKEIIIDTSIDTNVRPRFERYSEPQPCGFGSSDFIVTMWKRIENH